MAGNPDVCRLMRALAKLKRIINVRTAFFLFRNRRFAIAALLRYWLGLTLSALLFIVVWEKFIIDPSLVMRYGKILVAFVPMTYGVMKVFSRVGYYRTRKDRMQLPGYFRHRFEEDEAGLPSSLWQGILVLGLWLILILTIYLFY